MSQEKVDRYKAEKKNRKATIKKEKRKKLMWKIFGPVLAILVVALIGAGIYFIPQWTNEKAEAEQAEEIDYDQLMQMINQSAQETPADGATDDAVADDAIDNSDADDVATDDIVGDDPTKAPADNSGDTEQ